MAQKKSVKPMLCETIIRLYMNDTLIIKKKVWNKEAKGFKLHLVEKGYIPSTNTHLLLATLKCWGDKVPPKRILDQSPPYGHLIVLFHSGCVPAS